MTHNQPMLRQRARGVGAFILIVLLMAGTPLLLVFVGATPWSGNLGRLGQVLTSPDDGTLALTVFASTAWIAWAVVAISVATAVVSRVRGVPAPSVPGLGFLQRAAGQLVATAALLFVAAPSAFAAFPAIPTQSTAVPAPEMPASSTAGAMPVPATSASATAQPPRIHPTAAAAAGGAPPHDYVVKRGDSLWRIADRLLGDGARYGEIVDLNDETLGGRPDFIIPGTVLKVPSLAENPNSQRATYVVQPGDTLSAIANETLGNPDRYRELFDESRGVVQPDGASLVDPDLIRPGWQINVPMPPRHKAEVPTETAPPPDVRPPESNPSRADEADSSGTSVHSWLVPGLTGAGTVLAALVFLALRANRNTQLRYRRPREVVTPPPPEFRDLEKTAFVTGAPIAQTIDRLDQTLRALAEECTERGTGLPPLATVTLTQETATMHLADAAELPEPWSGSGLEWSIQLNASAVSRNDAIPPYPLLVSVGQDDTGELRLVNLEHVRVMNLSGDQANSIALARHIAAELALNPWSVLVDVTVVGFGQELADLDSLRLHHFKTGEAVVPALARSLASEQTAGWNDPDPFRAIITTGEGADELAGILTSPVERLGAAGVFLDSPVTGATVVEIDRAGRLMAPDLGLDLRAAGLTSDEATACSALVDLTRESERERIAPFREGAEGWRALADQAGGLREELTDVRDEGPAGDGALLPASSEQYAQVAATTPADVEVLAPIVHEQVRRAVESADPTLEQDVADWFDPDVKRPRLTLLGPVGARAFGAMPPAIARRRPYFVEILAFLSLHPEGVTGSTVAEAFGVAGSRARTDLGSLREWLGVDPNTNEPHLPAANESPAYRQTGVKTYQVRDVLVDLDLFRRLRARGEARGSQGIPDLQMAMSLVNGEPFTVLRERGWSWLLDGERLHETIAASIVDTAHVLVIDALTKGDLQVARDAAELACRAAPYDDICRLDLVKVAAAEGRDVDAETILNDEVFDRSDDYLPPIDLPERTKEVVGRQQWGNARRPETA